MIQTYDAAVVGGGFFGCEIAAHLRNFCRRVVLLEQEGGLLQRASYHNQARVHTGYHYPRSALTALRSRINQPRFSAEYADCLDRSFAQLYAIPRKFSKITASQFFAFCCRIGAPIARAEGAIRRCFNADLIEEVFAVEECAFHAGKLRERVEHKLAERGVEVCVRTSVHTLEASPVSGLRMHCVTAEKPSTLYADCVFLCTYWQLNQVLHRSGLPLLPLKHEWTEIALVEMPEPFRTVGVTVMCGPFFSFMPFPPRGLHTLSHVRYTPHEAWHEGPASCCDPGEAPTTLDRRSSYPLMARDVRRYLPSLEAMRHVDSLWQVKTVLPSSETDDSRPILFRRHHGLTNLHCILGAKIDNIYDACAEVTSLFAQRKVA